MPEIGGASGRLAESRQSPNKERARPVGTANRLLVENTEWTPSRSGRDAARTAISDIRPHHWQGSARRCPRRGEIVRHGRVG